MPSRHSAVTSDQQQAPQPEASLWRLVPLSLPRGSQCAQTAHACLSQVACLAVARAELPPWSSHEDKMGSRIVGRGLLALCLAPGSSHDLGPHHQHLCWPVHPGVASAGASLGAGHEIRDVAQVTSRRICGPGSKILKPLWLVLSAFPLLHPSAGPQCTPAPHRPPPSPPSRKLEPERNEKQVHLLQRPRASS